MTANRVPKQEVAIRSFSVGLIALAAFAAARIFFRRPRSVAVPHDHKVEDLYAAGL